MNRPNCPRWRGLRWQRGVAAIEFSLVLLLLLLMLYGLVTLGAMLYVQQAVSRAAGDGARAIAALNAQVATDDPLIRDVVIRSLSAAQIAPTSSGATLQQRRDWLVQNVTISIAPAPAAPGALSTSAQVTVRYPFAANRPLPALPLISSGAWVPAQLTGHAMVAM